MELKTDKTSTAGFLVALGIIFGDIGTSPLYVFKAIAAGRTITPELALGGFSCIFWTITLLTTLKYVVLVLRADNNGEGGILSLYTLVRRQKKILLIPAMMGGATLLADGIITPPISVSSAVEGLRIIDPHIPTVPIVLIIITLIFSIQHLGTSVVGRSFGPVMLVWFSTLGLLGAFQIAEYPSVLRALNPIYAIDFFRSVEGGFWLLGAVFLCTTGAEGLYSDLGHCGRGNIRVSWGFVKTCLILNYGGQAAWLLQQNGKNIGDTNPFFALAPEWALFPVIFIATLATIIASQALISGSFTLVTEAVRLKLLPKFRIIYPSELKGQIYVPAANWFLLVGCFVVVLYFRESSAMEAAYGLAITLTMLMTTILMSYYLRAHSRSKVIVGAFVLVYLSIEGIFLFANFAKFFHGGWFAVLASILLFTVIWFWHQGSQIKNRYTEYVPLAPYLPQLQNLTNDTSVPKYSTHLVYMTGAPSTDLLESKVIYSIFRKRPKRSDTYWFLHVDVVDEPYTMEYVVTPLVAKQVFRVDFRLGFRIEPRINMLFRIVIEELAKNGEVDVVSRYESLRQSNVPGDFRFVVLEKFLSVENALSPYEKLIMDGYFTLKQFSLSEEKSFGLDTSSVTTEKVPLVLAPPKRFTLKRVNAA